MTDRLRVVVAKPGMDGHDRGAKVIARALRDAGMEVIYTGIFQTSESILDVVLQEDADVLGISLLSGAHIHYAQEIGDLLRQNDLGDVLFLLGGTIPKQDIEMLKQHGVAEVFGPGTPTSAIVKYIHGWAATRPPRSGSGE
jgi:methylmalonyl-CoA mutase C-terminal domain/subunit